ncbi:serine/threonine-protein kinase pim-1-like [Cheilinus undulatus]|uniref:serine/threonine-protein kinase pim-1-like n=1 Tax=Cheilinus undulatus TaxID=241271 RepID=UPI001BD1E45A|nr:serine/threonine-protein kinase pim-1-like [Cheilinus undulatus]
MLRSNFNFGSQERILIPAHVPGAIVTGSELQQTRKRKAPKEAERQTMKRKKIPVPSENVSGVKRKCLEDKKKPRKRLRISEQEKATGSLETRETATVTSSSKEDLEEKYFQLDSLGEGGFGSVYAGYRKKDFIPVAIKHIPKDKVKNYMGSIPQEVAIMQKLTSRQEVGQSAAISLLDYCDLKDELILVLERPIPAMDLYDYMEGRGEPLNEEESRQMLKQLVDAALELQSKKVFHRDIKTENILLETGSDVPRLRLIDFGLSCFSKRSSKYRIFCGTPAHAPPEFDRHGTYRADPTTVWQMGVVLYDLLHWGKNDFRTSKFLRGEISIRADLPPGCKDFLRRCLRTNPKRRPSLEELRLHPWLA